MKNALLKNNFDEVCKKIIDKSDKIASETELEDNYEILLNFLIKNKDSREELVVYLKLIISAYRNEDKSHEKFLPGLAIAYCMHVLRWPEIHDFLISENINYYSKKMSSGMSEILDAYSDDWADKDFYRRFNGRHATP